MKKIGWLFAMMPLLAILFYWLKPQASKGKAALWQAAQTTISQAHMPTGGPKIDHQLTESELANLELEQRNQSNQKENDARHAKVAEMLTPEMQKIMLDASSKRKEPQYRNLFQTWGLSSDAIEQALAIINEREKTMLAIRMQSLRDGHVGIQKMVENGTIETAMADMQLAKILGDNHLRELLIFESKLNKPNQLGAKN